MRRGEGGFTLLEIIVALAIATLGIAAMARATGSAATVAGDTRERMLAVWVAGNRLSELRLARAWPAPGTYDTEAAMGGRDWYLRQTVTATPQESIRRVEVEVFTDRDFEDREHSLFGYLARHMPPVAPGQPEAPGDLPDADDPGGAVPLPGDAPLESAPETPGPAPDEADT